MHPILATTTIPHVGWVTTWASFRPAKNYTKSEDYYEYLFLKAKKEGQLAETCLSDKVKAFKGFNPTKITRYRDGNMLIQVPNKAEYDKAINITLIGKTDVTVTPHNSMNQSRGVITDPEIKNFESNEAISEFFQQYGVVKAYRFTKYDRQKQIVSNTNSVCLTFNTPDLPSEIKVKEVGLIFRVKPYYPRPQRCFQCNKYGHPQNKCLRSTICAFCSEHHHEDTCTIKTQKMFHKCSNCEGNHAAFSTECKEYKRQNDIIKIMVDDRLPRRAATIESYKRCPDFGEKSFAQATAAPSQNQNQTIGTLLAFIKTKFPQTDLPSNIKTCISEYESSTQIKGHNTPSITSQTKTSASSKPPASNKPPPPPVAPKPILVPPTVPPTSVPVTPVQHTSSTKDDFHEPKHPVKSLPPPVFTTPIRNQYEVIQNSDIPHKDDGDITYSPDRSTDMETSQSNSKRPASSSSPPTSPSTQSAKKIATNDRSGAKSYIDRSRYKTKDYTDYSDDAADLQEIHGNNVKRK